MTEEVAVRIAEALESIRNAIWAIEGLAISLLIIFGIAYLVYIVRKD